RGGVGLQRVGAQGGAAARFRRGEQLERGQHVAAARFARGARCGLRLARRRGVLLFILFLVFVGFEVARQGDTAAVLKFRLGARARRTGRGRRGLATAEQQSESCLQAEEFVRDPAERDRGALLLLLVVLLGRLALLVFVVGRGAPAEACGDRKADE